MAALPLRTWPDGNPTRDPLTDLAGAIEMPRWRGPRTIGLKEGRALRGTMASTGLIVGLLAAAFLPPVCYAVWIRNLEKHAPEPWGQLFKAFAWGATGGVLLALVLESLLHVRPDAVAGLGVSSVVVTAVVVAPLVEEGTKVYGLKWVRPEHIELEDGLVYGAAVGFGFAATENLVYGVAALIDGGIGSLVTVLIARSISAAFLHGAASAILGFALWRVRMDQAGFGQLVGAYLLAVGLHAAYNLGASIRWWAGFAGALVLVAVTLTWLRRRVLALDRASTPPL